MARRRKGRDVSGWVIVDKPAGMGSTDVVNKVRWAFQARKAGHAGTLDPDATGLLAVALGEATKLIPLLTDALKSYDFRIAFGAETTTDDSSGTVTAACDLRPSNERLQQALEVFVGQIDQVPPQVSAVRVEGQRAYDLAREGIAMELAARPLHVESLTLLGRPDPDHADLRFVCGKGGYVRSIARDLGRALGTRAHVVHLRRIRSGPLDVDDAVTLDLIDRHARTSEIDGLLRAPESGLAHVPRVRIAASALPRLRNGNPVEVTSTDAEYGDTAWADHNGKVHAIGIYRAGQLHPKRVLNRSP